MIKKNLLFLSISFCVGHLNAQQKSNPAARTTAPSVSSTDEFHYGNQNEPPRAIEFKEGTVKAASFPSEINKYFKIPAEFTFTETESNTDDLGMRHHVLQQYHGGLPLEGLSYRAHERNGYITSVNGKAVRDIKLNTQIDLSEEQAFDIAVKYLHAKDTVFRHGKKLIVSKGFTYAPESFSIAYQFDIDVSLIERWRISIDAGNGQVINKVSLVNDCFSEKMKTPPLPYGTGTGLTRYYGNKTIRVEKLGSGSRLVGQTEHGGFISTYDFQNVSILSLTLFFQYSKAYDFFSSDNTYNSPYQKAAVSAQWAAEQAYEYYFNKHNRNSFDNLGGVIKSYVHVDVGLNNAFWTGKLLAFGDGSNNNPLVELDVVSHELTHGVTQYETQLQYYNESGALNESFSDILGKSVEFNVFGDSATWQLARHYQSGGLRDLSNPNVRNQPDTWQGDLWYTGGDDNGGVHTNSGVQNFWFYLLCKGGSGTNDKQFNYSVNAIGIDAASKIAYRNLTEYLTSTSDYLDSRIGSLLATADLYGKNSATYQAVANAWDAVGVIAQPVITSLEVYDITATTVKIKGNFAPRADTATYHFEYGTTPALGSSSPVYGYKDKVEGIITGLQSETKYYLRLVASNENGDSYSPIEFTTISLAPLVKIKQTVDVTETTASLHGMVNPNSLSTSFYFEYGTTPAYGLITPSYPLPDTTEFLNVSATVTNLQPRQTYYYRLVATNSFATVRSDSSIFFTATKPTINSFAPVAAPVGTVVTISGQNFNSAPEKNVVSFGATHAVVLSSSSTEIKVKVPAGASFGTITLLDVESGLAAESVQEFVPTFSGDFKKGDLQLRAAITEPYVWRTYVHDMDGDNKPDIVGIHYQGFSIFLNVNQGGDITNESFVRSTVNVLDFYSSDGFQVVDFDGNGLKDIVGRSQYGIKIYPNLSVPGYIFFGTPIEITFEKYLSNLVYKDFDQDGRVDIAGSVSIPGDSCRFTVLRNQNPKGLLSAEGFDEQYSKKLPYYIYSITSDDLNNDGKIDLMLSVYNKSFVSILKNKSLPGAFDFEEILAQDPTRGRYALYDASDLNQDGWKDIVSCSPIENGNLALLQNVGSSNISMASPAVALSDSMETTFLPADINGDGKVDLMVSFSNRKFAFLKNMTTAGGQLSSSSLNKFEEYGTAIVSNGSGTADTRMTINDLNGDGRPEVINEYSYNFGPHDTYQMEIWQNAPANCLDPSTVMATISNNTAKISLPANTTFDQFQMDYAVVGTSTWWPVSSTTFYISTASSYQLRVRAKCYLGFTDYSYINFIADCVDINSLYVYNVGVNGVSISANKLSSFEIQYSLAGKGQWQTLSQASSTSIQITNLLPGTTFDLRFRGRCNNANIDYTYKQFTTLCPQLTTLTISDIAYNKASVKWASSYTGSVILEYSTNNYTWTAVDKTQTLFPLIPGKQYYVRGRLTCTNVNSDFITTNFTTPCPAVSTLSVDQITPFAARINWTDDSNTKNYTLTYSKSASGSATLKQTTSTSFNIDHLSVGTKYYISVAPNCIGSKTFTSTTFNTICYAPSNLIVNNIAYTTADLSWNDIYGGLPYSVEYSISGSNDWWLTKTALTNASLSQLRPGTKYEARVHINCPSVTAPYVSQVFETELYPETVFSPNPTNSKITIYPSKNLIGNHYTVFDSSGKIVSGGEVVDYTFDLSLLPSGIYLMRIDGEKIVKIVRY